MEIVVRSEGGMRWIYGLDFAAPNWWPGSIPWPDGASPTAMSDTLWTVLLRRAIAPDWELVPPPIDLGGKRLKLVFRPRNAQP